MPPLLHRITKSQSSITITSPEPVCLDSTLFRFAIPLPPAPSSSSKTSALLPDPGLRFRFRDIVDPSSSESSIAIAADAERPAPSSTKGVAVLEGAAFAFPGARVVELAREVAVEVDGPGVEVDAREAVTDGALGLGGGAGGQAYSRVHSRAVLLCCSRLRVYSLAIEGTSGSLGLGSVSKEDRERTTLNIDRAGDQLCFRMSMHTLPRSEMFMW